MSQVTNLQLLKKLTEYQNKSQFKWLILIVYKKNTKITA